MTRALENFREQPTNRVLVRMKKEVTFVSDPAGDDWTGPDDS
jgi:hypothetical protein